MVNDDPNSLDRPFARVEAGQTVDLADVLVSAGVVIQAIACDVVGRGPTAGLLFKFARPDGTGFYPPVALLTADDQLRQLATLIDTASAAAVIAVAAQR
jgi:hypothetical protein